MRSITLLALFCLTLCGCGGSSNKPGAEPAKPGALPTEKASFKVATSIYAGWMPWYYGKEKGIVKKWADKYNIEIEVLYMDYVPSIEAYVAGKVDACTMTNMEALNMPAAAGIDSTAIIIGDYSNGNDAVLVRNDVTLQNMKEVMLCELTVSQYLLARGLEQVGRKESDVKITNVSDADIATAFSTDKSKTAAVTWNPMVQQLELDSSVKRIYDSSKIPGEILDLMVANTATIKKDPRLALALTGAWYEIMALMSQPSAEADAALAEMASLSKCTIAEYKAQLKTTAMFWTAKEAQAFTTGEELRKSMDLVRKFSFEHGMLGQGVTSPDVVGIAFPGDKTLGDAAKVKLRFSSEFMGKAAAGEITIK
jgi:NitT/TauT family transport system substrate-binding protein